MFYVLMTPTHYTHSQTHSQILNTHNLSSCTALYIQINFTDCVGLTSTYEIAMLQDESLKLLSESSSGAMRMGHILLTLPYIRSAADRKVIQV